MNAYGFIRLMTVIFGKRLPDTEWIQRQGLLAVKIGQTFALRIDFLDEARCIRLAQLFNHVESIPPEGIVPLMDGYLGKGWQDAYREFDTTAYASASVGQVHRAVLKTGETVAVKVLKQHFREAFQRDVDAVMKLFRMAIRVYPTLSRVADPVGTLESIRRFTLDELDLTIELRHHDLLEDIWRENREKADLEDLRFPRIHREHSTMDVLVSEFIEGETFDTLLAEGRLPYDRLLSLFHLHGFYVFGVGTFHGDIHPGNIILSGDKICFVDCGAIGRVQERMRVGLFRFMEALSHYAFEDCARWLNRMSERPIEGAAFDRYRERFLELYRDFAGSTVSQVSLTQKMMETIKLGVRSGMVFEQGMYPIIKSLMYLDGMVLKCKPEAVLMEDMRPFVGELNRFVGPEAGE